MFSGGWSTQYYLGQVKATPEFDFPLQLVYSTTREDDGLFGSQWFCPQLESTLLPVAKGYLLWTMPSGQQSLLTQTKGGQRDFRSQDGLWRAQISKGRFEVSNEEGWQFQYAKSKLVAVISPTQRILEFHWKKRQLTGVRLTDTVAGGDLPLLHIVYGENERVSALKLHLQDHKFAYKQDGTADRLTAWAPPVGEPARILYQPDTGVLWKVASGDTDNPAGTETFTTQYIDPDKNGPLGPEDGSKRRAANHWLFADRIGNYKYGTMPDKKAEPDRNLNPAQITLTHFSGLIEKTDYSSNRGVVTSTRGETKTTTYYYRAPGKRYDGKLRRIEQNGHTLVEYRYQRHSGLLIETIDANGVSTYFDYDPDYSLTKSSEWDPKPLRIRRGTRRKSEVVAEYRYDEKRRITAEKDRDGNLTQYAFTPRGELASVMSPAGDRVDFTYDKFGRKTSVSSGERTEKIEYDENGNIAAHHAPDGTKTEILYNEQGHQTQIKRNEKLVKELVRDELHRVIGEKDSLGRVRRVERDIRGNLTAEVAPNGSITRYDYDESNRRTAQIDGNGNRITFEYDASGRLTKQTNALGNFQSWKFDPKTGKLLERANGEQLIRHTHSPQGRLTAIDYGSGQKLTYTYDREGRPLTITGPDSSFEFSYDPAGRLLATRAASGDMDFLLTYRYNLRGQRTGLLIAQQITSPGRPPQHQVIQQTEQFYDSHGRLATILTNGIPAISYQYDLAG